MNALPVFTPLSTSIGPLLANAVPGAGEGLPKPALVNASQMASLSLEGSLTVIALVFLAALIASKLCIRLSIPANLGVLLLGVAIAPDTGLLGPEGAETLAETLHVVSLSMLLFYAGLSSNLRQLKRMFRHALMLAIGGVMISSLLLGLVIWLISHGFASWNPAGVGLPLSVCFLIAASLGSTDAGVTLSVLKNVQLNMPSRVKHLIEFESSVNDPTAIMLLLLVLGLSSQGISDELGFLKATIMIAQSFLKSIGSGILVGLILTYAAKFILNEMIISRDQVLVVGMTLTLSSYGISTLIGGSGYITAFATGAFLSNNIYNTPHITPDLLENSFETFNSLMEMLVFLLFGLLFNPIHLGGYVLPGILISLSLMLVVRPLSVLAFQPWSPLTKRETVLLSWCGLRGAVPLALSYTVVHALPQLPGLTMVQAGALGEAVQNLTFVIVVTNLCLQGISLPRLCRRLGFSANPGS